MVQRNLTTVLLLKTAQDIKTDMKIIPVDTFEQAVEYLEESQT